MLANAGRATRGARRGPKIVNVRYRLKRRHDEMRASMRVAYLGRQHVIWRI